MIFVLRRSLEETPAFLAMKKHPTASEVFASAIANWRIVILGMMIAVLTTTTFYFITVYAPGFGKQLNLSPTGTLLVTLLVAVTNFIWNPVGGAVSDRIGRKTVLLTIAGLSFVTAYPALSWLAAAPTFEKLLAVQMMFSFYFGVYSGTMLGCLVEIVPAHVRTTCFSIAFALAAGIFGTATPFVATKLIELTGHDKASPAYWLMFGAALGIIADADRLSRRADHRDPRSRHRLSRLPRHAAGQSPAAVCISMQITITRGAWSTLPENSTCW